MDIDVHSTRAAAGESSCRSTLLAVSQGATMGTTGDCMGGDRRLAYGGLLLLPGNGHGSDLRRLLARAIDRRLGGVQRDPAPAGAGPDQLGFLPGQRRL